MFARVTSCSLVRPSPRPVWIQNPWSSGSRPRARAWVAPDATDLQRIHAFSFLLMRLHQATRSRGPTWRPTSRSFSFQVPRFNSRIIAAQTQRDKVKHFSDSEAQNVLSKEVKSLNSIKQHEAGLYKL